jgi:hypothetical protein
MAKKVRICHTPDYLNKAILYIFKCDDETGEVGVDDII